MALIAKAAIPYQLSNSNRPSVGLTAVPSKSLKKGSQQYYYHPIKCTFKGQVVPALLNEAQSTEPAIPTPDTLKRTDFPADFIFGAATSALQTEGSGTEGGRGPSTWDSFIQDPDVPGIEVATDSYHRYKDDVKILKEAGLKAYRFSISWSRILPNGTISGGINQDGVTFYTNFITELRDNGIEPFVTLFHFDLPKALQDKYKGFLSSQIVVDFKEYAGLCFKLYGDKVKYWCTINEPQVFGMSGFKLGLASSDPVKDPLIANHHIILAHAAAVKEYKDNYQAKQGGKIGIPLVCEWFEPHSNSPEDQSAADRARAFLIGWYLDPLVHGDYPAIVKDVVGSLLPKFTESEKQMVKGSFDFIGVNYYTSRYVKDIPKPTNITNVDQFRHVKELVYKDGVLIGNLSSGSQDIRIYPEGLKEVLLYLKDKYAIPKIFITENGIPDARNDSIPVYDAVDDDHRIYFIKQHLCAVSAAMRKGVNVQGYLVWALLDCMEMPSYYNVRFGLYYTDYKNNLNRLPKNSAQWFNDFLKHK